MAIIYTYPRLNNPDGTELIVVSETKNQNATRLIALSDIAALVPSTAGGTITGVKVDFASHGIDTGLRLWNVGFTDTSQNYIAGAATFEIGGTLRVGFGGTGLSTYADGDVLYYDSAASTTELQTVTFASAPVGNGDVLTLAGGLPTWATPTTGTMSSWIIDGDTTAPQIVSDGDTVNLIGGTVIDTIAASGGAGVSQVTINHAPIASSVSTNNITLAHGGTFTAIDTMGISGEAHVVSHNTTTYTLPAAGGSTGHGFSPCPVAISDVALMFSPEMTVYYLTVAEHTMTLANFKLWGRATPVASQIEFAVYRAGIGPTTWSSAVLIGKGTITGAVEGSNEGVLIAEPLQNLNVNVGENLIVGLRRIYGDWTTIGDNGVANLNFGVSEIGSVPFTTPPAQDPTAEENTTRFALTLY